MCRLGFALFQLLFFPAREALPSPPTDVAAPSEPGSFLVALKHQALRNALFREPGARETAVRKWAKPHSVSPSLT